MIQASLRIVAPSEKREEVLEMPPRTFFFAGKAAPAYRLATVIIKFLNNLAGTLDGDPAVRGRLKVVFLPEYGATQAERLIPASDVSNEIATTGYEASGTSNMEFMMNGALTVGTRDGATIEMAQEAGEENFFLFGRTADQVAGSRGWYNPHWHYENEPETRPALDLIFSGHFSRYEPGVFGPLQHTLLTNGDYYMYLADLKAYLEANRRLVELCADPDAWVRKAILNVAGSGKFSSDRKIVQYAAEIWDVKPCPVAEDRRSNRYDGPSGPSLGSPEGPTYGWATSCGLSQRRGGTWNCSRARRTASMLGAIAEFAMHLPIMARFAMMTERYGRRIAAAGQGAAAAEPPADKESQA